MVITIIVLLILAGITINALTGSDSAPAKANEAEQKNDIGSAKDQISLTAVNAKTEAYDTVYVGNGVSSTETSDYVGRAVIKAVVEQITSKNQYGKATVEITGFGTLDNITSDAEITITTRDAQEKGTITLEDGVLTWGETKSDKINSAIGQVVNYSANNVNSWRVFYADAKYMYIISTTNAQTGYVLSGSSKSGQNKYSTGAASEIFTTPQSGGKKNYSNVTYGATYNSKWLATSTTDAKYRSQVAAYLCDPAAWDDYVSDSAPTGTFAVGGPTKELLVLSWNAAKDNGGTGAPTVAAEWNDSSDVSVSGYTYNSPFALSSSYSRITTGILPTTVNNTSYGLYNPINSASTGNYGYWLASPCSFFDGEGCYVSYFGYVDSCIYDDTDYGVRPLVAIPISEVSVSGSTVSIK